MQPRTVPRGWRRSPSSGGAPRRRCAGGRGRRVRLPRRPCVPTFGEASYGVGRSAALFARRGRVLAWSTTPTQFTRRSEVAGGIRRDSPATGLRQSRTRSVEGNRHTTLPWSYQSRTIGSVSFPAIFATSISPSVKIRPLALHLWRTLTENGSPSPHLAPNRCVS